MGPLGDETGLLVLFGVSTVAVVTVAIRLRARRGAIITTIGAGALCAAAIYLVIVALSLLTRGTGGYQFATWLVFAAGGLIPAVGIGLLQGLVAGLIVRLLG